MKTIKLSKYKKIVILTGAGVSTLSGIRPFRGKNGLWNEINPEKYSNWDSYFKYPEKTCEFQGALKNNLITAAPNIIHKYITQIGQKHDLVLITQNIDRLHNRAGSKNIIELHGTQFETRCTNYLCELKPYIDIKKYDGNIQYCKLCGSILRPNTIMFGELINDEKMDNSIQAIIGCDLFIAIGTSGSVTPASTFVNIAKENNAKTIYINEEDLILPNNNFDYKYIDKAENVLSNNFII